VNDFKPINKLLKHQNRDEEMAYVFHLKLNKDPFQLIIIQKQRSKILEILGDHRKALEFHSSYWP